MGYLVTKKWLDEWKIYSNYEEIKDKYSKNGNELSNEIKQNIINDINDYFEENKNLTLSPIKIIHKNEIKSLLQKNSLVLVDYSFISEFNKYVGNSISYNIKRNTIKFDYDDNLIFKITNNIILPLNEKGYIEDLKQLIKIFIFQEELKDTIKCSNGNKFNNDSNINEIILINSKIIKKYKEYFYYKELCEILKDNNNFDLLKEQYKTIIYSNIIDKSDKLISKIIDEKISNTYISIIEQKKSEQIIFDDISQYNISEKSLNQDNQIKYINGFEIINKDIYSFFKQKNNFNKINILTAKYITTNGKIIIYNDDFIEIGIINDDNDFIIQYLIKEINIYTLQKDIIDNINMFGIDSFIKNEKQGKSEINIQNKGLIAYCYKVETLMENENNINNNNNDIINKDKIFLKKLISILVSFFKFNKELKTKIEYSSNGNNTTKSSFQKEEKCFLINKQFVNDFKKICSYENIFDDEIKNSSNSYINIETNIYEKTINKTNKISLIPNIKKELSELFNKSDYSQFEKIDYKSCPIIYIPSCFDLIDENTNKKILSIINDINTNIKTMKKANYGINKGKIILKINEEPQYSRFSDSLYLFSVKFDNKDNINYIPEMILYFNEKEKRINHFNLLCNGERISKYYPTQNSRVLDDNFQYICESFLLKNDLDNSIENKNIDKLKIYLSYIILIYKECLKIQKEIKEDFICKNNIEEEYYLINPRYVEDIEKLFNFKQICKIIDSNKALYNNDNYIEKLIRKINKNLDSKLLDEINGIDETIIKMKLNNKELYKLEVNKEFISQSKVIKYFNNYNIINKEIIDIFQKIDNNSIKFIYKPKKCILGEGKIIYMEDYYIIIGNIDENNIFSSELLINSNSRSLCSSIFDSIKSYGMNYLKNYISDGKILDYRNNYVKEAIIYDLVRKTDNCYFNINHKLKALIILSLYQRKLQYEYNDNEYKSNNEEVFLFNPKWLKKYEFNEIKNVINNNQFFIHNIKNIHTTNLLNNTNYIDDLLLKSNIDKNVLNKFEQNISNMPNDYEYKASEINIQLINNNNKIIIYKDFIILDQLTYVLLQRNFNLDINYQPIKFVSNNNWEIMVINNNYQHIILLGNYNKSINIFRIKYILDFSCSLNLAKEYNYIKVNKIEKYIKSRLVFSNNNNTDLISPIFSDNEIIGYGYKYKEGINDYSPYFDYSIFLSNTQLINMIYLYYNEIKINQEINQNNGIIKKEYYLITNNLINKIKIENNYKQIKEQLDNINELDFLENIFNKKNRLYLIKCLSIDILSNFINSNTQLYKYRDEIIDPDIIRFDYFDHNQKPSQIFIYNNFTLIPKSIIEYFIGTRSGTDVNNIECILTDKNIIINYPKSINTIEKYVTAIGELDYECNFITKYLLIYDEKIERYFHINKLERHLKYHLDNTYSDQKLVKNSQPITGDNYKEIGTFVKYAPNNNININNNINFNNNNNYINNNKQNEFLQYGDFNKKHSSIEYDNKTNDNYPKNNKIWEFKDNISPHIKNNFPFFPLIGFENIGATCYMNATLQCFCHIEKFVDFFKYSHQAIAKSNENSNILTYSFKLLIEEHWPENYDPSDGKNKFYAPYEFKNKISKMNKLFDGVAANDSKDLVNFIIMTLHEELNKADKSRIINNNIILDQSNQQLMFKSFGENFVTQNQSIISDLFYGINCNITQCGGCGVQTFNYQTYFFIVFPLEEVRKYKENFNQMNNNYNYNNNEVTIFDCFNYDKKINIMSGENSMYCNYCKRNCNSSMCTTLTTGPEILILLLNRGKGIEFNVKINFTYELNLFNYIQYNNSGYDYKLIGVITHMGESGMGGHFIAYCCDPLFEKWYKYNDAIVSEVIDFQNEVINYAMPYLLFYQKFK